MKKRAITALTFVGIIMLAVIVGSTIRHYNEYAAKATVRDTQTTQVTPPTVDGLLRLVNEERSKNGVAPLVIDERLNQSAQRKADDMQKYNYFDHVSPNDGKHGYEYINDTGITCRTDSENLAWNTDKSPISSEMAVSWWKGSQSHHKAMIDQRYTSTGFGIDGYIVVEHFCEA